MANPPFGGSAGREGIAVQLGATDFLMLLVAILSSEYFTYFLDHGYGSRFWRTLQTPIAATFALERVLTLGQLKSANLGTKLSCASFVASTTSHLLDVKNLATLYPKVWY